MKKNILLLINGFGIERNDSYNVYYLDSGVIEYKESSSTNRYNIVIYIDGDEIIDSGMGTQTDPYVIN